MTEKFDGSTKYDENLNLRRNIASLEEALDRDYHKPRTRNDDLSLDGGIHYEAMGRGIKKQEEKIRKNIRERLGIEDQSQDSSDQTSSVETE